MVLLRMGQAGVCREAAKRFSRLSQQTYCFGDARIGAGRQTDCDPDLRNNKICLPLDVLRLSVHEPLDQFQCPRMGPACLLHVAQFEQHLPQPGEAHRHVPLPSYVLGLSV